MALTTKPTFYAIPLPWPEDPSDAQIRAAGEAIGIQIPSTGNIAEDLKARVNYVLTFLSESIEYYAPNAPLVVKRAAAERYFGFANSLKAGGSLSQANPGGSMQVTFASQENQALFKRSGASEILGRYRIRRATVIGGTDDGDS